MLIEILIEIFDSITLLGLAVLLLYCERQYLFALVSIKHSIREVSNEEVTPPSYTVSVLIAARNEEKVIDRLLRHLVEQNYDHNKMEIIVLNDASTDKTSQIAHEWESKYSFIRVIDRLKGGIGKGDVLNQGVREAKNEIILVFDADYTPAPDTLARLLRWFDDPKVGLVQGNVHVSNKDENLLTKMVNAERAGGFQCDLYARDILKVSNQYGGTVGGFRKDLIKIVGEWRPTDFSEDSDLTCRTLLAGYKVKYDITAHCGEEAPSKWKVYYKQRYRWIRGGIIMSQRYSMKFLRSPYLSLKEKFEGVMWLNINCLPAFIVTILGILLVNLFLLHSPVFMIPSPWSYVWLILTAGGLTLLAFLGLLKTNQVKYTKYILLMIANAYPMCFIVTLKAYYDVLTNKPLKWTKTERSGFVA